MRDSFEGEFPDPEILKCQQALLSDAVLVADTRITYLLVNMISFSPGSKNSLEKCDVFVFRYS
jgi:hypothetical protein